MRFPPIAPQILRLLNFTYCSLDLLICCLSYDADEVTAKAATPPRNEPLPEHKEILAPPTNIPASNEMNLETPTDQNPEAAEHNKQTYGEDLSGQGGQNGALTWNDTQVNEDRINNYNDGSAEEESRGVGIKEDG